MATIHKFVLTSRLQKRLKRVHDGIVTAILETDRRYNLQLQGADVDHLREELLLDSLIVDKTLDGPLQVGDEVLTYVYRKGQRDGKI